MRLWNVYCSSEICISITKYVLTLGNMSWHSEIRYPDGMHTFANHQYRVKYGERVHNGLVPAHVLSPSSYRVLTACTHPAKSCHTLPWVQLGEESHENLIALSHSTAKPNGPIPFDLNDKRCNLTGQIVFSICHRAHTDLYRVYTGSCPTWYRTLRPHTVLACLSHRVITVCIPLPLKYAMLL